MGNKLMGDGPFLLIDIYKTKLHVKTNGAMPW